MSTDLKNEKVDNKIKHLSYFVNFCKRKVRFKIETMTPHSYFSAVLIMSHIFRPCSSFSVTLRCTIIFKMGTENISTYSFFRIELISVF